YKKMAALDAATGKLVWEADVPYSFGTPANAVIGGVDVVITAKGDFVRATDGKVLAKGLAKNQYNGPLISDGIAYFIDEAGAKALELPKEAGDALAPKELWAAKPKKERYYSSPVLHEGLLYAVTQAGTLSVLDAKTGEIAGTKELKDASPGA